MEIINHTGEKKEVKIYYDIFKIAIKQHYYLVNDQLDGEFREFLEKGQLISITTYKNGIKSGPYTLFYSSGQVYLTHNYVDGKVQGEGLAYYQSGVLKNKMNYIDDVPKGEWISYDETGQEISRDNI